VIFFIVMNFAGEKWLA